MPTYHLQFTFGAANGSAKPSLILATIEADTDGEAIAEASRQIKGTYERELFTATLKASDGRPVWSLRSPEAVEGADG